MNVKAKVKWYSKSTGQIEDILETNAASGLTRKAARLRSQKYGKNEIYKTERISFTDQLKKMFFDFSSVLLALTAVIAAIFERPLQAVLILILLAVNYFVSVFTYYKSLQIIYSAALCSLPRAKVVREGKMLVVDSRCLVPGDLILLSEGDIVPADARIVEGSLSAVEYDPQKKRTRTRKDAADMPEYDGELPPSEQKNTLFAGSLAVGGSCRAVVTDIGDDTYICSVTGGRIPLENKTEIPQLTSLNRYCRRFSLFMLILIFPIVIFGMFFSNDAFGFFDLFLLGLSLTVASLSELIPAIGRIIVACGVANRALAAKDNAIIKNMSAIDKMAKVTKLVLTDKCALTTGKNMISGVYAKGTLFASPSEEAVETVKCAMLASGLCLDDARTCLAENDGSVGASPFEKFEKALAMYAAGLDISPKTLSAGYPQKDFRGIDGENVIPTLLTEIDGEDWSLVCADAETILKKCTRTVAAGGIIAPMRDKELNELLSVCREMQNSGSLVYAAAKARSRYNNLSKLSAAQEDMTLVGLIGVAEETIENMREAISDLLDDGVETVLMLEGDTVQNSSFASAAGIIKEENDVRVGLEAFRKNPSAGLLLDLTPREKAEAISIMKENGEVVAVVGTESRDVGLLRVSDASFTCSRVRFNSLVPEEINLSEPPASTQDGGEYGSSVMRKNCDVIIRRADREGEGICSVHKAFNAARSVSFNLRDFSSYLIFSQFARIILVIAGLILSVELITPSQILMSGLITDMLAALVFAFRTRGSAAGISDHEDVFFSRLIRSNIPMLICAVMFSASVIMITVFSKKAAACACSFAFVSLCLSQMTAMACFYSGTEAGRDGKRRRPAISAVEFAVLISMAVFLIVCFLFPQFGALFEITRADPIILAFSLVPPAVIALFYFITRKIGQF